MFIKMMLSAIAVAGCALDADKQIGVILFVNTAIRQEDSEAYGAIFDDLWQLGVAIKGARAN